MKLVARLSIFALLCLFSPVFGEDKARSREFLFTYQATICNVPVDEQARIWLPVPPSNQDQTATEVDRALPGKAVETQEPKHHNKVLYLQAKPDESGEIELKLVYRIVRREVRAKDAPASQPSEEDGMYLVANSRVPVGGKALRLIADKQLPIDQMKCARVLYNVVDDHMTYRKDKPGYGNGDSDWACDSQFGNCTDFHSLFISLARAKDIPAKFEIGFPVPTKRGEGVIGGYHCWAKFKPQGRDWIPVDISEANKHPELREYYFGNLCENRVMFTAGRDLTLVPKQAGEPLNYFVYPYVEVGDKAIGQEQIRKCFSYKDIVHKPS